ncbi:MAG: argininosuccinate lyase [Magnetococcales bacterium]|nr:argininosuccinate lyase [Magnetococcales bacterium]
MKHLLSAAVLLSSQLLLAGSVLAGPNQDFTLINKTGYVIDKVFVSPSHSEDWEEDVLGRDTMPDGETVPIHFSRGTTTCEWDLKVVYEIDNSSAVWHDIDLCSVSKISIFWNQSSGKTTAKYE